MVQVSLLKLATLGSAILTVQGSEDASNKNVVHREQQQPAAKAMQEEKGAARGTNNQRIYDLTSQTRHQHPQLIT